MTVHLVAVGRCQTPNSGVTGGTGQCNGVGSQGANSALHRRPGR